MKEKKLALFDFDGTITRSDSLKEFILFTKGKRRYYLGLLRLAPILALYKAGIVPNWRAKEILLTHFFAGMPAESFDELSILFTREILPKTVRPKAMQQIEVYKREGVRVIIVSASPENWIGKWAESQELEWIATRMEVKEEKLTGKISGKNCHGSEKVRRIQEKIDLSDFCEIYAFGDSRGDRPMLKLGTQSFYRPFV